MIPADLPQFSVPAGFDTGASSSRSAAGAFEAELATLLAGTGADDPNQAASFSAFGLFGRQATEQPVPASRKPMSVAADGASSFAPTNDMASPPASPHPSNNMLATDRSALNAAALNEASATKAGGELAAQDMPDALPTMRNTFASPVAESTETLEMLRLPIRQLDPKADFRIALAQCDGEMQVVVGLDRPTPLLMRRLRGLLESELHRAGIKSYRLILNGLDGRSQSEPKET